MQYFIYAGGTNAEGALNLTDVTWRSCIISFCTVLMFSGPTTDFVRPLRNWPVSEWRLTSLCQCFTVAWDEVSSPKVEIS